MYALSWNRFRSALLGGCLVLAACGSSPPQPAQVSVAPVDFSGAWELDFSQSDTVNDAYDHIMRDLQRQIRKQQEGNQGGVAVGGMAYGTAAGIYALARMAEIVTEPQLLDIKQTEREVTVKREGSFALECDFGPGSTGVVESPFGREACGWLRDQLVYQLVLPDGLRISHRLTVSPDGQRLQVVTQLSTRSVSQPLVVAQVFNRYDPNRTGIHCTQTLSKGRVCTTEKPGQ